MTPELDAESELTRAQLASFCWWLLVMLCMGGLVVESLMKGMK